MTERSVVPIEDSRIGSWGDLIGGLNVCGYVGKKNSHYYLLIMSCVPGSLLIVIANIYIVNTMCQTLF